ncbi:MAG TPA: hypothetical protein VFS58_06630 [Steroidobacteraceae bacterium]|nr:hypothetical protein [Steroidobacteraceae bacterium]
MNSLDRTLESFAACEPDAAVVSEAQRKLDAAVAKRLAENSARRPVRSARGWLAAGATAAIVTVAMLWLPFGSAPALAFAKVQEHFRDFRTLRFDMQQHMNGQLIMKARVSMTYEGNVRTDIGDDISVIVNSAEHRVLTLLHPSRVAVESPLDAPVTQDDSLAWLDDVRKFQGEAKLLAGTRQIRGQRVHGWELATGGGNIVLWATDAGLPLEMTMGGNTQMQIGFEFEFDPPFEARLFSTEIPAGYSRGEAED